MLMSEEELTVEVAQVDCIKVDDVDFAESREDEVFEELAADAAGANKEDARLRKKRDVRNNTQACATGGSCARIGNSPP